MKEHGSKHPPEAPTKTLKSLLKKPGQTKGKTRKNRVVINEKLNEFFAADYIILIKEECCAEYEEDCDCCCQEHELIRLGNCKECRAELNLHFGVTDDGRYGGADGEADEEEDEDEDEEEDDGVDEDDEEDEEDVVDAVAAVNTAVNSTVNVNINNDRNEDIDHRNIHHHHHHQQQRQLKNVEVRNKKDEFEAGELESDERKAEREAERESKESADRQETPTIVPDDRVESTPTHDGSGVAVERQQETLSPPEGYKDVCVEDTTLLEETPEHPPRILPPPPTCTDCDYYHRRKTSAQEQIKVNGADAEDAIVENFKEANNQVRSSTPNDLHHRYLVETITMTTVTERRIIREISENERKLCLDELDLDHEGPQSEISKVDGVSIESTTNKIENLSSNICRECGNTEIMNESSVEDNERTGNIVTSNKNDYVERGATGEEENGESKEMLQDVAELSLTFKLGNLATNSLKPNSAVRQLFPNPRFISPPPAPLNKSISLADSEGAYSEAQKFLITAENLRLFDTAKRSTKTTTRSESCESEPSTIKRTIERNTLRRSLIGKCNATTRKKNLRSKDLSLEERIRQLTCVDQDEDVTEDSTKNTELILDTDDERMDFSVRTSPSGEEQPPIERFSQKIASLGGTTTLPMATSATTTMMPMVTNVQTTSTPTTSAITTANVHNSKGTPLMDITPNQSAYRKITDLFAYKKNPEPNLPDLGLGNNGRGTLVKDCQSKNSLTKMNSEVRRQFLASLAPLSCVAMNNADAHEDYYRIEPRIPTNVSNNSINHMSDSTYSLEDIETALNRNRASAPDVTRGTPVGNRPDIGENSTDELLAFVEQDKSRMERIKRRYSDNEDRHSLVNGILADDKMTINTTSNNEHVHEECHGEEDDQDDELNDYGFNRRPPVRGIKPQFGTTNEIVHQLRSRSVLTNDFSDVRETFATAWPLHYDKNGDRIDGKNLLTMDGMPANAYDSMAKEDTNTIDRINSMQKQIDDIYQTIVETAVTQGNLDRVTYLDNTLPRPLVRIPPTDGISHQYPEQKNGQTYFAEKHQPTNVRLLRIAGGGDETPPATNYAATLPAKIRRYPATTLPNYHCNVVSPTAASGGGSTKCYRTMYFVPYSGLSDPTYQNIQRILPPHSSPNYATHIERYPYPRQGKIDTPPPPPMQQQQQQQQQLQQQQQQQQPQQHQQRYYPRPLAPSTYLTSQPLPDAAPPNCLPTQASQQTLQLHLHHLSSVPHAAVHPLQFQHRQHHHQIASYHLQSVLPPPPPPPPSYTVIAPPRCASTATVARSPNPAYHLYQIPFGRTSATVATAAAAAAVAAAAAAAANASDMQTQTVATPSSTPLSVPVTSFKPICDVRLSASFAVNDQQAGGGVVTGGPLSASSSSSSSALSSPTKQQQQQQQIVNSSCSVAERGVPEGAASAPSHDFPQQAPSVATLSQQQHHQQSAAPALSQSTTTSMSHLLLVSNSYGGHRANTLNPPNDAQNSVYYAMNV